MKTFLPEREHTTHLKRVQNRVASPAMARVREELGTQVLMVLFPYQILE